jgi:hypothetical protein
MKRFLRAVPISLLLLVIDQGTLRFQIDPIGSQDVQSTDESILVHEGERLSLTL